MSLRNLEEECVDGSAVKVSPKLDTQHARRVSAGGAGSQASTVPPSRVRTEPVANDSVR